MRYQICILGAAGNVPPAPVEQWSAPEYQYGSPRMVNLTEITEHLPGTGIVTFQSASVE